MLDTAETNPEKIEVLEGLFGVIRDVVHSSVEGLKPIH